MARIIPRTASHPGTDAMDLPKLHGIVPPLPTPLNEDESIDVKALRGLVEHHLRSGVHGLWILGTTGKFDLIPDGHQRVVAETVAEVVQGRVPLVLNVSDGGTLRTLTRAGMFDDLPFDYYAALPPWYQTMTPDEVKDYFRALADGLAKPLVIYNAPWVSNQLSFAHLRELAEHPRIVGTKDVTPELSRNQLWSVADRRGLDFSYLQGGDLIGLATELGADGFVSATSDAFPELAVALWDAARAGDSDRAFRFQAQFSRLGQLLGFGPPLACLEAACRHRGFLKRMLPAPYRSLDEVAARKVAAVLEKVGALPEPASAMV